ncbi:hypothetical protein LGQ02_01255 [Bacillus shivajii]|uniref:hypothetical protein n=1 Tax=Bacillus shivajii TaxID=1983719 RepID=UPI001CFB64FC|nr:hypothetical protein [Bacillus shivajii]UCZ53457.1 hypothetical protein LGQ02_01255 [Bacillus shivajii]
MIKVKKLVLLICTIFFISACGENETLEEAIENDIPFDVLETIHIEEVDGVYVVMYSTIPEGDQPQIGNMEGLGIAYFTETDVDGWKNVGPDSWTRMDHDQFTVYNDFHREFTDEGEFVTEIRVVHGKVNNPEIEQIKMANRETPNDLSEATMIHINGDTYYFMIGDYHIYQGYSEDGELVFEQGG